MKRVLRVAVALSAVLVTRTVGTAQPSGTGPCSVGVGASDPAPPSAETPWPVIEGCLDDPRLDLELDDHQDFAQR